MACRFSELCVDCRDPVSLAGFWREVLDYRVTDSEEDMVELTGPEGAGPTILFVAVPEDKIVKNRLHMDVSPTDREQDEEVERILALGATRADVGQGEDATWVVMQDPEGNEFCVLRTRREPWGK